MPYQLLYTPELYIAEHELAHYLTRLARTPVAALEPLTDGLLHKQPQAVANACTRAVSILTGPPGTGKTTTTRKIVDSYIQAGLRGAVFCPTGKAAKRADEVINFGRVSTDRLPYFTTHSGLQYSPQNGGFKFNRTNKLTYDFIIMDEFPMQELTVMRDFVEAIEPGRTRLVFSGDQYQLPSVGPGNVGRDMIQSDVIPRTELDVVLRTGPNSGITANASQILRGLDFINTDISSGKLYEDCFFVPRTEEKAAADIIKWITESIPDKYKFDAIYDIQLLCPGKKGLLGTELMNKKLRDVLNPGKPNDKTLCGFRKNDKVINNKNSKKLNITNGDVGVVKEIQRTEVDKSGSGSSSAVINFGGISGPKKDGLVEMNVEDLQFLKLCYAVTVHKFQGCQAPCIIMPIFPQHYRLLTRNLVYTGLTRAMKLGMLVGNIKTFRQAIKNNSPEKRRTRLMEILRASHANTPVESSL